MDINNKIDIYLNEAKWFTDMGVSNRLIDKKTQVEVIWKPGKKEVKVQFSKYSDKGPNEYIGHAMVPTQGMKSKEFLKYVDKEMKTIWSISKGIKKGLTESIFYFSGIFDAGNIGKKKITLPVVGDDEKSAEKKFKDMISLHIKNGHLPKGKLINIKIDSKMG